MFDALVETAASIAFWVALAKIIWVNILLSGDNAVVIALAARSLPPHQQKRAVIFGSAAAIVMRVLLTLFAVELLQYPYLKLVGAALLLWIGIQLLVPDDPDSESVASSDNLWTAIRTILIADLVMSLDNVIAVAAAAESGPQNGKLVLLLLGLGLSIPLIVVGSQVLLKIMDRWPIIITAGAGLLGFVAGEMALSDPALQEQFQGGLEPHELPVAVAGAIFVVVVGTILGRRRRSHRSEA